MITKEEFEKLLDIELTEQDGKLVYSSTLDISIKLYQLGVIVTELPENLRVIGDLILVDSDITQLPKGLEIEGSLIGNGLKIKELPNDIKVKESIYLAESDIETLPNGLHVEFTLSVANTPIKTLPSDLEVKENLYINGTDIEELPKTIKKLSGSLIASNSKLKKLPKDFVVGCDLILGNTPIEELSEGLIVQGITDVRHSYIDDLSRIRGKLRTLISDNIDTSVNLNDIFFNTECEANVEEITTDKSSNYISFTPKNGNYNIYENSLGKFISFEWGLFKYIEHEGDYFKVELINGSTPFWYFAPDKYIHGKGETKEEAEINSAYNYTYDVLEQYQDLTFESELTIREAIIFYRLVTGCQGYLVKRFFEKYVFNFLKVINKETISTTSLMCLAVVENTHNVIGEYLLKNLTLKHSTALCSSGKIPDFVKLPKEIVTK